MKLLSKGSGISRTDDVETTRPLGRGGKENSQGFGSEALTALKQFREAEAV